MKKVAALAVLLTAAVAVGAVVLTRYSSIDADDALRVIAVDGIAPVAPGAAGDAAAELIAMAEAQLNRGDTEAAAQSYAQALAIYRDQRNVVGQATVAFGLGRMDHFTGQSDGAREKYAQALDLYMRGDDALGQARVLVAMGDLEKDTFQWDEAVGHYRRARELWASAPYPKSDPHVLLSLATVPDMPAGEQQARSDLEQAELIYVKIGDDRGLGEVRMLAGSLSWNLGDLPVARQHFAEALALFRESELSLQASATLEIARSDLYLGFNLSSAKLTAEASDLFSQAGDPVGMARARALSGDIERLQGNVTLARDEYSAAATALESLSHRDQPAVTLKLAQIELVLGNPVLAAAALESAIALSNAFSDLGGEAAATLELGAVRAREGDPQAAALILRAIGLFESLDDPAGAARGYLQLARFGRNDDPDSARAEFAMAVELFEKTELLFGQILAELGLAELEQKLGNEAEAQAHHGRAAALMAAMETSLAEANRFLGLPPVSTLFAARGLSDIQYNDGIAVAGPIEIAAAEANERANLIRFPDHNPEGRALLASVEARLSVVRGP